VSDRKTIENLRRNLEAAEQRISYPFLRSAVVVPLLYRNGSVQIVLELRANHLRRSPGEVGFPGGRIEPGESPWEAALRELEEELGVVGDQVELLGRLPEQQRRREELIVPFVCRFAEDVELKPDGIEVAEVFTLPLDYMLRTGFQEARIIEEYSLSDDFPTQYLPSSSWRRSLTRPVHYLVYKKYLIWGLSANILLQVRELIG
jgi:8-oxo-dGTP pyrophosphatase MutT (NUDIX family)